MLTYRKIKLDENGQKSLYLGRKEKNYSSKKNDIGLKKNRTTFNIILSSLFYNQPESKLSH